ncbi:MAG: glycosyltransferase [Actinomycetes bacterium]
MNPKVPTEPTMATGNVKAPMRRLAILSMHTSPLAQPGTGDGGGMNVYVREMASALARAGSQCDVFTRSEDPSLPGTVAVEPGFTVHNVVAGPVGPVPKEHLEALVPEFTDRVLTAMTTSEGGPIDERDGGPYDLVHANYWLSGLAGHIIKHELDIPLISTFHTLDRVKAEAMPEDLVADLSSRRAEAEASVIACSDAVLASCTVEAEQITNLYGAAPERITIVPPGVDHAFFGPGDRAQARRALALPSDGALLLFVGRIQPLKGAQVAVEALGHLLNDGVDATLVIVGGPSGVEGASTVAQLHETVRAHGLEERVLFRPPQPHELLSSYYRAADVTICPSRSESFGLVALESSACGTPVVAAAVGGLTTLVDHGVTGALIDGHDSRQFATAVAEIVTSPLRATRFSTASVRRARGYTWRAAAETLGALSDQLVARRLVHCG